MSIIVASVLFISFGCAVAGLYLAIRLWTRPDGPIE
jgi:hypothetical protein